MAKIAYDSWHIFGYVQAVVPMPVVEETLDTSIPGLDSSLEELERLKPKPQRKVPYARPVPSDLPGRMGSQQGKEVFGIFMLFSIL